MRRRRAEEGEVVVSSSWRSRSMSNFWAELINKLQSDRWSFNLPGDPPPPHPHTHAVHDLAHINTSRHFPISNSWISAHHLTVKKFLSLRQKQVDAAHCYATG